MVSSLARARVLFPLGGLISTITGLVIALFYGEWSFLRVLVALVVTIDMEIGARTLHRDLWHAKWLWWIHSSHHNLSAPLMSEPGEKGTQKVMRKGWFEANDWFVVFFALISVPTMAASFQPPPTLVKDISFGMTIGFTLYGISYFVCHDLIAHRRGGGELAEALERVLPSYVSKCVQSHMHFHHSGSVDARPYGFFLPETELEQRADHWIVVASHRLTQAAMFTLAALSLQHMIFY
mmetsp:Transcript_847/g.1934  ORF Transcript_847/g.1934 Transcript_847/m.1934 type:complete len:237 (-) Transcript_847:2586-3296(-)